MSQALFATIDPAMSDTDRADLFGANAMRLYGLR
jgi:hypothetical protein